MGYSRKIIYLNEYEGSVCGESAGFAKISKKETRLKMEITLSGDGNLQGEKIYLLDKDQNSVNKVLFGTVPSDKKKIVMMKEGSEAGQIKGEPVGIMIGGENHVICAGTVDHSIRIGDYIRSETVQVEAAEVEKEERVSEKIIQEQKPDGAEREKVSEKIIQEQKPDRAEGEKVSQEIIQEQKPDGAEREKVSEETNQEQVNIESRGEEQEEEEIIRVEIEEAHDEAYEYRKIFSTRANMYPFEDDEMEECVQISPADFSDFPKRYWQLGSNTFLLQGYYNYRHLILARTDGKMYLGIPGQYHRRDKYLADMFGFGRFKGIHKRQERLGDFGYWLMEIDVPQSVDEGLWDTENYK